MLLAGKHQMTKKKAPVKKKKKKKRKKKKMAPAAVSPADDASEVSEIAPCTAKADSIAKSTENIIDINNITTNCNSLPDDHADATNHEILHDTSSDMTDNNKKRTSSDDLPPSCAAQADATAASRKRRRYQKTKWGRAAPVCKHNVFTHFLKDPARII